MKKLAKASCRRALLQGTLDLLILQTLTHGPAHGQMLAFKIFHDSKQAIRVSSTSTRHQNCKKNAVSPANAAHAPL